MAALQGKNAYQGKNIVIAGLGVSGLSCVEFFLARGVIPQVTDSRAQPPAMEQLPPQVPCHMGELYQPWLLAADLIILSPGLALTQPALMAAASAGVEIIGDIELFCREAQAPIVAITGSNGKSTVTSLVGEMAKQAGVKVAVGGNLGLPALRLLDADCQLYVLELSSFQLETTYSLRAAAATVLNISDDHMDRYPAGLAQYRAAKLRIYHQAACCVVNAEDAATMPDESLSEKLPTDKLSPDQLLPEQSLPNQPASALSATIVSFGAQQGDYHLLADQHKQWLAYQQEKLLEVGQLLLAGQHNYTNALAALALAAAVKLPRAACLQALCQFRGLAHRFQLVLEKNGVRWINDSKATNVGSTLAALQGFQRQNSQQKHPQQQGKTGRLHLLLGGDGKAADFSVLLPWLQAEHILLYCYGRDRAQLAALRPQQAQQTDTLRQAMQLIAQQIQQGDTVLLSPACASLDQFTNFAQRGDEFTRLAQELG